MRKTGIVIAIIVVIGILVSGCIQETEEKYRGPVEKITVANTEEYSTLIWIAQEQGYFTGNGLDIIMKDYQSGKAAADALLAGEADISISAEFVLVSNSFDNPDLRALGTVDTVENMELIVKKDSGILQSSDLKGKRIGATKKSVGEFFLGTFLVFNGLSLNDIEIVDLKPKDMTDALLNGDVDAVLTWPPNTFDIKNRLKDKVISWSGQSGQKYNMILIAKEKFIEDNPKAIERFLKSIIRAEEYVKNNNKEAKDFIAKKYNYESLYIDDAWPKHNFVVELPQALLIMMEDQARWRIENKLTDATEVPNYLDYIYFDALEEVKPEGVTIIR
jgi:NitT/TauT family transport system substrate-binding protein